MAVEAIAMPALPRGTRTLRLRLVGGRGPASTMPEAAPLSASIARVGGTGRSAPPVEPGIRRRAGHPSPDALLARARSLWPGMDPRALARTRGELARIVRLVTRRSGLPETTIAEMLVARR